MSIVETVMSIFAGRPRPDGLPPVSPETITRAEATASEASQAAAAVAALGPARPVPTPALLAKPRVPTAPAVREEESPAVAALRLEVQQLRLIKTPDNQRALADRVCELQEANDALSRELQDAALQNERLANELVAAHEAARK
jgi:hypothetical protein